MSKMRWLWNHEHRLAIVMGIVDGILTAMVLAAGRLLGRGAPVNLEVALRVAAGALATAGFVFFIARYVEYRGRLVRAEFQLNLTEHGRLAATNLGRSVLRDASFEALISGVCSFVGAALPLAIAVVLPSQPLLTIALPIVLLGLLGLALGKVVKGSPLLWAVGLLFGGMLMTAVGFELHLV